MKLVVQRVTEAGVSVDGKVIGKIGQGLLVLVGVSKNDSQSSVNYCVQKLVNLRIFNDEQDKMNKAITEVEGELLVVSQFTLYANTKKGNRPSYVDAAPPAMAEALYNEFVKACIEKLGGVQTGSFGAMMQVSLTNDGPVTIIIES